MYATPFEIPRKNSILIEVYFNLTPWSILSKPPQYYNHYEVYSYEAELVFSDFVPHNF